jgi:hypothetical protein
VDERLGRWRRFGSPAAPPDVDAIPPDGHPEVIVVMLVLLVLIAPFLILWILVSVAIITIGTRTGRPAK